MEEQVVTVETTAIETPAEIVVSVTPTIETTAEVVVSGEPQIIIPPPKKKTAQERIDEITFKRREAEREAEYWKNKAMGKEVAPTETIQPALTLPVRPVKYNFESDEAYEDALLDWNDKKKTAQTQVQETERKQKEAQQKLDDAGRKFDEKADPIRTEYEDFDDVVQGAINSGTFTPAMRIALLHGENGPEVAYFLARPENRTTVERIKNLPPELQPYELGKLETALLVAKKTRKVPTAPAPINPLGASGPTEINMSDMAIDEWMKENERREKEKLRKRMGL